MKKKEKEKSKENESSNDIRATRFPTSLFESRDSLEDDRSTGLSLIFPSLVSWERLAEKYVPSNLCNFHLNRRSKSVGIFDMSLAVISRRKHIIRGRYPRKGGMSAG